MSMGRIDGFALPVAVTLQQNGIHAVSLVNPPNFTGDELRCLIPGNPFVFTFTAGLGIAVSVGIPIHALKGIFDPVGRIHPFFVGQRKRPGQGFPGGLNGFPVTFDLPLTDLFLFILPAVSHWPHTNDLTVFDIHHALGATTKIAAQAQGSQNCFVFRFDGFHGKTSPLVLICTCQTCRAAWVYRAHNFVHHNILCNITCNIGAVNTFFPTEPACRCHPLQTNHKINGRPPKEKGTI